MSDAAPSPPPMAEPPVTAILALIWAGVSLGGNLIAAPAKFTVEALTLPVALQVGRAQFGWIGYAEWLLLAAIAVSAVWHKRLPALPLALAIGLFIGQYFAIQPALQAQSDVVIAGGTQPASSLHLVYVMAELAKFVLLTGSGAWTVIALTRR